MARMRALRVRRKPHTVFFKYRKLRKNRPREQDFDVWRTLAEVKAGSARFLTYRKLRKIARVGKTLMCGGLRRK